MDDAGTTIYRNRWAIAGGGAFVAFLLFWFGTDWGFLGALVLGLVLFILFLVLLGMIGAGDASSEWNDDKPYSATGGSEDASPAAGSTVPPTVGGGGAAAGGGAPAATSPAATGTPLGEGADSAPDRTRDAAVGAAAGANGASEPSGATEPRETPPPAAPNPAPPNPAPPDAAQPAAAEPGVKPATLDAPRNGSADDLKRIKGVGPKLEAMCNRLGFWHFEQIADWTDAEIAWVDRHLEGFRGRVRRDNWVAQARELAGRGGAGAAAPGDREGGGTV